MRITRSIHHAFRALPSRRAKKYRRDILLAFSAALEPLGGRPSKKVSTLLVDEHDNILNWDVNHLCYGIEKDVKLFVKGVAGGRGHHTWCAERNNIASHLGVAAVTPESNDVAAIHAAIDRFTPSLIGAALYHPTLAKATLVSSHYPCVICAEVLAPQVGGAKKSRARIVREVITTWNEQTEGNLTNPNRKTADARKILESGGIRVTLTVLRR